VQYAALILEEKANKAETQSNNQLIIFFKDFFRVILIFIGILLILKLAFSYNVGNLVTGLSIIGAAIALATRESLENLIASFIIFFDKPFATGDLVKVQGFNGTVEKIGLRSTRIRTDQKTFITVPNKQMVDTILDNISMRTQRKAELKLEIALTVTQEQLRKIIPAIKMVLQKDIIENNSVFLSDTGRNAHIVTVEYFTSMQQTITEFNALREEVNFEIIGLLNKNHISLAGADTNVVVTQKKE
jgi:MscS family membrane protein